MTKISNQHIEMNSTISCILLGAVLIGITNFSDGHSTSEECVSIASNESGKMQCEPSKHIHIETISLDNEVCPSKPWKLISSIPILTCQGIRYCSVPFKTGGKYKYLNIRYKCTGCQSAKHGSSVNITCQQNTRIKIEDVWMNWKTACPAYNDTHHQLYHIIPTMCNSKQTCTVNNSRFKIMSIYFSCEVLTTTKRRSTAQTTTLSVKTKKLYLMNSKTTYSHLQFPSTIIPSNTTVHILIPIGNTLKDQAKETFPAGAVAGGVVAGIMIICLSVGVLLFRRRNNDHTKSPQKQFVTRSNLAYESDMDVGTDGNPNKNKDSSLYHHYFEVENDPDIVTPTHNYINTDTMTYDYASGHGSLKDDTYDLKDDTYDNVKQEINVKQNSEGIDLNTYSHLQDTFIDSDENTYNHTIHDRVPSMPENDYSMSRGQMSDDDYDVSGNHYRGHHIDGSEAVYN